MNAARVSGARSRMSAARGDWGLGIGYWGDWWMGGLITTPHSPQSPIPDPQSPTASVFLHRHDDFTLSQRAGRRAVAIDVGDHGAALPRRQVQPPRHRRRDVLEREPEAAGTLRLVVLLRLGLRPAAPRVLLGLEIELLDGDVERLLLLVAQDLERHRRPGFGRDHHLHELVGIAHRPAVELHDDVARFDAGLRRG